MTNIKLIIFSIYVISVAYTQFRGKIRLPFLKQAVNHSTIMAPINALMYLFSAVPNQPYQNLKNFPELTTLQSYWPVFKEEAQQLISEGYIKAAENNNDMGFNSFFKRGWKRFYIKWYNAGYLPSAQTLCPKTIEILKKFPSIKASMFTLLPKQGQLKPHRDPYAGSLRYHLGLITPNSNECRIYVDGIPYAWRDGEAVLFDETYIHSAKNDTDYDRIIFFCDIERPMRYRWAQAINTFFSYHVMSHSVTQNIPSDPVGFINKIYSYYHQIAAYANRLKKSNRKLYRVIQYGGVIALAYWFFF